MTDRRHVLQMAVLVAGVAALPACTSEDSARQSPPTPDPQQADELALIAAYDAAIADAGADRVAVLTRIREEHISHVRAMGWEFVPSSPTASPTPVTRADLVRFERRASRSRSDAARDTSDPQSAQILALIAASESQHVVELESL